MISAKNFARYYEKKISLGTSDAWLLRFGLVCTNEPASERNIL